MNQYTMNGSLSLDTLYLIVLVIVAIGIDKENYGFQETENHYENNLTIKFPSKRASSSSHIAKSISTELLAPWMNLFELTLIILVTRCMTITYQGRKLNVWGISL